MKLLCWIGIHKWTAIIVVDLKNNPVWETEKLAKEIERAIRNQYFKCTRCGKIRGET